MQGVVGHGKLFRESARLDVAGGEKHRFDGTAFPSVFVAQRGGHPVVFQLFLELLAPFGVLCVVADEGEVFVVVFQKGRSLSVNYGFHRLKVVLTTK